MRIIKAVCLGLAVLALATCDSKTDKIGNASTVFRVLGKNDRIEIEGFDDADVKGITYYLSYAKKGGLKEAMNLEEDTNHRRSEERRVGKECRSRWSPYH